MSELQHQTDIEQAKSKLQEVEEAKAGRKDPRAGELAARPPQLPERRTVGDKNIRPVKGKPKKKSFGQKMKEAMFSDDIGNGSVTEHIFFKIFIPSVKRVLSEMANTAINMALGLDPKTRTISANTHTANASVYRDRNYNRQSYYNEAGPGRLAVSELEWDKETAEDIMTQIEDIIDRFGEISIADMYSMMDMGTKIRTTDSKWGWTRMNGIEMVSVDPAGERWIIDMPPARPINR